ncbi:hypothetical protein C0992_011233, partial [Termitomyces sp. T32_za158]
MTAQTSTINAETIARVAKEAFEASQLTSSSERVDALHAIRSELESRREAIMSANKEDLQAAQAEVDAGHMSKSLLARLDLSRGDKWNSMLQGVIDVAALPDPTGTVTYATKLDDELELYK